jgi:glycosyltransferase involved in cell wall biosynthesis
MTEALLSPHRKPKFGRSQLLCAVALVKQQRQPFLLEVVGEGTELSALLKLSESFGISEQVHFRGPVPHHQLPTIYQQGSAFVLSSRHEPQCMAALEAAACGLPVVGTAVGVIPELAPEAAIAVPVGDEQRLAQAIIHLLGDPDTRIHMGRAAARFVQKEFSLRQCAQQFVKLYTQ